MFLAKNLPTWCNDTRGQSLPIQGPNVARHVFAAISFARDAHAAAAFMPAYSSRERRFAVHVWSMSHPPNTRSSHDARNIFVFAKTSAGWKLSSMLFDATPKRIGRARQRSYTLPFASYGISRMTAKAL